MKRLSGLRRLLPTLALILLLLLSGRPTLVAAG